MGAVGFAERDIWNVGEREGHSGLMLAARITLAHFSVSSAMNLPKPAGYKANTVPPKSAIWWSARPRLISLLSLSITQAERNQHDEGPHQPIWEDVGSSPTRNVAVPITTMDTRKVYSRQPGRRF
jgi:hypothetical protein